ncbi:MAG: hypothetical protein BGO37_08855 [Cellulomonas sp. 73-92]|uniref:hypothetical protein n=1 Tax=Cellulomonas sp. 73-92 TaxID=1895740 RepID=UPI00092C43E8|nr:hypothetical protein [Cellulomonas sp. 73-92]OJV83378.1 MAG: hypothetical protein BGO37_08855 [Cellulomonas sp. 73-92]
MTDRGRQTRRLAALSLVPLSVGGFGGGLSWAASHQAAATPPAPVPTAATTTDPQLTQALAEIADARDRIAALQATLDQRAAAAGAATSAPAAPRPVAAPPAKAPAAAPARPAPAPPPPVHTTTKASG